MCYHLRYHSFSVSFVGDCGAGDLARADTYPVKSPGLIVNRLIQGGERFQAITLTAPGSVTLRHAGIRPTFFIPPPTRKRGHFVCSDPALNEIWELGAYSLLLNQVPVRSLSPLVSTASTGTWIFRRPAPQDVNAFAILFGVAPADQWNSILQKLKAALYTANGPLAFDPKSGFTVIISPFLSSFETWARFESSDATGALSLIRTEWGHMRKGQPFYSGGTWERMTPDAVPDSIATSLAHGWGSGPTSALSKYVLGVRPVSPGYKTWLVEPQPGDLIWAKGRVPTPHGPIQVRWEKEGNEFVLLLEVPDGTLGTVGVPVSGSPDTLFVNGQR